MIDTKNRNFLFTEKTSEQLPSLLEKIFAAAQSDAVYSKPVISGNHTVITASEISSGGGFGSGSGFGPSASPSADEQGPQSEQVNSGGGGFGGGGGSTGRPVAVIIIGPDGVTVRPVFDITKIVLAGIAAWIVMLTTIRKVRKTSKG